VGGSRVVPCIPGSCGTPIPLSSGLKAEGKCDQGSIISFSSVEDLRIENIVLSMCQGGWLFG